MEFCYFAFWYRYKDGCIDVLTQTDRYAYSAKYIYIIIRGVWQYAFQNISISVSSPFLAHDHPSIEERSHSLPPFIILIATLPFTRQTSSPLAQAQEGRLEGTVKENCHLFPPVFLLLFPRLQRQDKMLLGGGREKERDCMSEWEEALCIVYSVIHSAWRWLAEQTATLSLGEALKE